MSTIPPTPPAPETLELPEGSGLRTLLKRRYFRRMWTVTSISSLGDWIGVFALTSYVQEISGRPEFAVGGVLLFKVIPGLFFGPFAGVLADRFDRRRLMVTADLARAALIACIPLIDNLWGLYAVSAGLELLGQIWTPAKDATLPNLVEREQLMAANQLSLVSTYATFPLGGAIVTALAPLAALLSRFDAFSILASRPIAIAFFVDAGTFLFSAWRVGTFPAELMRTKRAHHASTGWNPFNDLAEGLRFVGKNPLLRTLIFGAWTAFAGGSAIVSLGPIFAARLVVDSAAAAQAAWGALIVSVGLGLVGGMIVSSWLARLIQREHIFPIGLMCSGLAALGTASMTSIKPALGFTFFVGVGAGVAWVTIFTLLQERTEDRLRGRTFATLQTGIKLSLFVGLAGWPLIAGGIGNHVIETDRYVFDLAGVRVVLWGGGVFLFAAGLFAARSVVRLSGRSKRGPARSRGLRFSQPALAGAARPGLFFVFEGVEGAGKSTQIKLLHDWLQDQGHEVLVTREPGGTAVAERIRNVLLDPASHGMDPKAEALLYAASRAQLVSETIKPALERNAVVLCDRYIDSSLAYQGVARGLGEDDVLRLNVWATDETMPDLVILLHLDPADGLARQRGLPDRIEQEDIAFHRKVGDAYLHLAREYPSRFAVIDAAGAPEQIHQQIRTAILPLLRSAQATA